MAYGLTATGFLMPTLAELIEERYALYRAEYGDNIDLTASSPLGQLAVVESAQEFAVWEGLQAVHNAFNPDTAVGVSLDNVAAITGTTREEATPSTVTGTFTGTPTTLLPTGRVASTTGTTARFATLEDATIAAASAWSGGTYGLGDRVTNGGNVYQTTTAGTSVSGPSGTGSGITDGGTAVWIYLGAGTGVVDAEMASEETGPVTALAGTLTTVETAVAGWSSVINLLDADLGTDLESDPNLRLRRVDELRASGNAAVEAVRAKLLQVDDVTTATVFENYTDTTDADGIPPHAIECLVQGGDEAEVRDAIFAAKAAGIRAYGTDTGTVTDSEGTVHDIDFTRPTEIDIWVIANLVVNATDYPLDGDDQIEAVLVAYGDAQRSGKNVVAGALEAQCFGIPGVLEAECLIKTSNPPTVRTTIPISLRQIATFDTSRITVATTPGTP